MPHATGCAGVNIVVFAKLSAVGSSRRFVFSNLYGNRRRGFLQLLVGVGRAFGWVVTPSSGLLLGKHSSGAAGKTYGFTIMATDANTCSGSRAYTLAVAK